MRGVQAPSAAHVQAHPGRFPSKHKPCNSFSKKKLIPEASRTKATTVPHFMHTHTHTSCRAFPALGPLTPPKLQYIYIHIYIPTACLKRTGSFNCLQVPQPLNIYIYTCRVRNLSRANERKKNTYRYTHMSELKADGCWCQCFAGGIAREGAPGSCAVAPPCCTR